MALAAMTEIFKTIASWNMVYGVLSTFNTLTTHVTDIIENFGPMGD